MRTTLNLLPPEKKADLRVAVIYAHVRSIIIVVLALSAIVSFTLLSVRIVLDRTLTDLTQAQGTAETEEFKKVTTEINDMNAFLGHLDLLSVGRSSWTKALDGLDAVVPSGVTLTRVNLAADGNMIIYGHGRTRDDVLAFRRGLEESPLFTEVSSPLANILQRTDVNFELDTAYAEFVPAPSMRKAAAGKDEKASAKEE